MSAHCYAWVVVRRENGRFVRRIKARSSDHADQLKQDLETIYDSTHTVTIESERP